METDKNIWLRIIKKSKKEVLIKMNGAIRSMPWDEFNSMFIVHPTETNLAKLRETYKKDIVNSIDEVLTQTLMLSTQNNFDTNTMENAATTLLSTYITELERKTKCSAEEVKDLLKQRMEQLLTKDQNVKKRVRKTNK